MKKDKFIIINLAKDLVVEVDSFLVNFPNKELELKRAIKESSFELLTKIYEANATSNLEKRKDIQEILIAKIEYIDFLINLCYDKKLINGKKYLKFGESLDYILKYVNGWISQTKKQGIIV